MNRLLFILFILAQSLICDCGNIVRAKDSVTYSSTILNDSLSFNASMASDSIVVDSAEVTEDSVVAESDEQQKTLIVYAMLGMSIVSILVSLISVCCAYKARKKVKRLKIYVLNELEQNETTPAKSSEDISPNATKKKWQSLSKMVECHDNNFKKIQKDINKLNQSLEELQRMVSKNSATSVNDGRTSKKHYDKKTKPQETTNKDTKKQISRPTSDSEYKYLKVVDGGKLTLSQTSDNSYYRAWMFNDVLYYEFHSAKVGKAINNRTSIIEPFCDISDGTIDPDTATNVETTNFGELSQNFTINKKATILYK